MSVRAREGNIAPHPMKRFDIITEADARVLEHGSTVRLAPGGHVAPLARDTLAARRISVVRDDGDPDLASLVPVAAVRVVAVGSDRSGDVLRAAVCRHLRARGLAVTDLGGDDTTGPADYPDVAAAVAWMVTRREADAGIAIDGSGIGSAIAANKIRGARAAMCQTAVLARWAREHCGANVLTLGATLVDPQAALAVVDAFLDTPMLEPRYIRRLAKVRDLEAPGQRTGLPE